MLDGAAVSTHRFSYYPPDGAAPFFGVNAAIAALLAGVLVVIATVALGEAQRVKG